eukprot:TRINITY_DN4463_c0_g2_i1.p1 TRINITY_DN4463_c0_g2~~TRINITY_DN4463_c0_g2_i1.p1  ORF type:complete len:350 (-),score=62.13 TRINITY_DN4463_c0_g2_i1:165-1214(-)
MLSTDTHYDSNACDPSFKEPEKEESIICEKEILMEKKLPKLFTGSLQDDMISLTLPPLRKRYNAENEESPPQLSSLIFKENLFQQQQQQNYQNQQKLQQVATQNQGLQHPLQIQYLLPNQNHFQYQDLSPPVHMRRSPRESLTSSPISSLSSSPISSPLTSPLSSRAFSSMSPIFPCIVEDNALPPVRKKLRIEGEDFNLVQVNSQQEYQQCQTPVGFHPSNNHRQLQNMIPQNSTRSERLIVNNHPVDIGSITRTSHHDMNTAFLIPQDTVLNSNDQELVSNWNNVKTTSGFHQISTPNNNHKGPANQNHGQESRVIKWKNQTELIAKKFSPKTSRDSLMGKWKISRK